jgi:hypothetical protein
VNIVNLGDPVLQVRRRHLGRWVQAPTGHSAETTLTRVDLYPWSFVERLGDDE